MPRPIRAQRARRYLSVVEEAIVEGARALRARAAALSDERIAALIEAASAADVFRARGSLDRFRRGLRG